MQTTYPLINALCNPALYPHTVSGFQIIETHLSWIILTGPYAYKIKKPLNLGFQDFTTLANRKHYCECELRYNQPLSGDLYQAVIPITGTPEAPALAGTGIPFEYAVKMRQFDPNEGFHFLADRKKLSVPLITALATEIARFHRQQPADLTQAYGEPEQVLAPMRANFKTINTLVSSSNENDVPPTLKETIAGLETWTQDTAATLTSLLHKRKAEGHIRACHGDLHLGNVVLYEEKPLVFDCIEFNEDFRWIDPISDLAFLAMDLAYHDLHSLKALCVNTYFEQSFDYEGAVLLPFYQCYRAMVRAKIALLLAQQVEKDSLTYHDCMAQFTHYIELADAYTITPPATLTITVGASGSGKSVYTEQLLTQTEALRLRSDVFRKHHFKQDPLSLTPESQRPAMYSEETTHLIYQQLIQTAEMLLKANQSVIIDAACLKQWQRQGFHDLADRLQIPFKIVVFEVPEAVLIERIAQRKQAGDHTSDATKEVVVAQLAQFEPLDEKEQLFAQWISTKTQ